MAMRFINALFDLPWWTGLPIFLLCNLLIPYGVLGYIVGCVGCLFGAWIFSKLVNYSDKPDTSGAVIVGLSVFFACMYYFTWYCLAWQFGTLFTIRTVIGLGSSLMAFEGFRHK